MRLSCDRRWALLDDDQALYRLFPGYGGAIQWVWAALVDRVTGRVYVLLRGLDQAEAERAAADLREDDR